MPEQHGGWFELGHALEVPSERQRRSARSTIPGISCMASALIESRVRAGPWRAYLPIVDR